MAELLPWPRSQFFDDNGNPLAGGKLYSYKAGSSIPLATFADKPAATPNPNPVVLNSRGEAIVYLSAQAYKLVLKDASDVVIWTQDNFVVTQTSTETLAEAIAAAQAAQTAAETAKAGAEAAAASATVDTSALISAHASAAGAHDATKIAASTVGVSGTDVQANLTDLKAQIDTKAASSTVSSLSTTVAGKADASTVSALATTVAGKQDASTAATKDGVETLTNKTIGDALTLTELGSTPSSPAGGFRKLYAKADGKLYSQSSAGVEKEVGSGASGGGLKNYIKDPYCTSTTSTDFYQIYDDGAGQTKPVDGTGGGAARALGWAATSTYSMTSLEGTNTFLMVASTSVNAGEGVSTDFSIDREDLGRLHEISVSYEFDTVGDYADGKVKLYVLAAYGGYSTFSLIEPVGTSILKGVAGVPYKHKATFQAPVDTVDYRLCFHVTSDVTSQFKIKFDSVRVGPQATVNTTLITDGAQTSGYTLSAGSGTITNAALTVNETRRGDKLCATFTIVFSGAGGTWSDLIINLRPGIRIDSTKMDTVTGRSVCPSNVRAVDAGVQAYGSGALVVGSTSQLLPIQPSGSGFSGTSPFTWGASDQLSGYFEIPIAGWGSNTIASADAGDGRVVAAGAYNFSSGAYTASTPINFASINYDTHAAITTGASWKYTILSAGFYRMSVSGMSRTVSGGNSVLWYKNGLAQTTLMAFPAASFTISGSVTAYLNAGDYIDLRPDGAITLTPGVFNIEKLQGPAAIVAGETVAVRASITLASQTLPNNTYSIIAFGSIEQSTHGSFTTAGRFTAPISGTYWVRSALSVSANATANRWLVLMKGGTVVDDMDFKQGTSATYCYLQGSTTIKLLAGEYIEISVYQNSGSTLNLVNSNVDNMVNIVRVGNY